MQVVAVSPSPRPVLSVVIPCRNEERYIGASVRELVDYLREAHWDAGLGRRWEIVLVDDGSTDSTLKIMQQLSVDFEHVRVCTYPRSGGQGKALQSGFQLAQGDWVIAFDADLDYSPDHIGRYLRLALDTRADIVVGSPYMKGGTIEQCPPMRLAMSRLMNWYFKRILPLPLSTFTCILRLYRRDVLNSLLLASFDKDLLPEILVKANALKLAIVEAPAVLNWSRKAGRARSRNLRSTAGKALRHLQIGIVENPFFVLKYPLILVTVGAIWMTLAVLWLFVHHFRRTGAGVLADITTALATSFMSSPHTWILMLLTVQSALLLVFFVFIVLQNKLKADSDFVALTKVYEAVNRSAHVRALNGTDAADISYVQEDR
jgi:glycosyltransferase involved in cell wall biosynthesis